MNYFVSRGGQQYGPYALADLQRYIAQGNVQLTDLARAENTEAWTPVSAIVGAAAPANAYPLPPGLHWAIVLLLTWVFGFFVMFWSIVQARYVRKIEPGNPALWYYAASYLLWIPLIAAAGLIAFSSSNRNTDPTVPLVALGVIGALAMAVLGLIATFSMRKALEYHFNHVEPINLRLSPVMTFFFNTFYFQYHLTRIRNWKLTGVLI